MTLKRVHLSITGRVQGVGFRASTRRKANEFGLSGWVKNLPDGSVEAVAEGEENNLKRLISWARQGPRTAKVEDVDAEWHEAREELEGFSIRY